MAVSLFLFLLLERKYKEDFLFYNTHIYQSSKKGEKKKRKNVTKSDGNIIYEPSPPTFQPLIIITITTIQKQERKKDT